MATNAPSKLAIVLVTTRTGKACTGLAIGKQTVITAQQCIESAGQKNHVPTVVVRDTAGKWGAPIASDGVVVIEPPTGTRNTLLTANRDIALVHTSTPLGVTPWELRLATVGALSPAQLGDPMHNGALVSSYALVKPLDVYSIGLGYASTGTYGEVWVASSQLTALLAPRGSSEKYWATVVAKASSSLAGHGCHGDAGSPLLGPTKPHGVNVSYGVFTDINHACDGEAAGHRRGYYELFRPETLNLIAQHMTLWKEQVVWDTWANGVIGVRVRQ
jgi:hypothetical protein